MRADPQGLHSGRILSRPTLLWRIYNHGVFSLWLYSYNLYSDGLRSMTHAFMACGQICKSLWGVSRDGLCNDGLYSDGLCGMAYALMACEQICKDFIQGDMGGSRRYSSLQTRLACELCAKD